MLTWTRTETTLRYLGLTTSIMMKKGSTVRPAAVIPLMLLAAKYAQKVVRNEPMNILVPVMHTDPKVFAMIPNLATV